MFDEKEIAEFQSLKAPAGLRMKVLADCQKKKKSIYKYIQTVAASLAVFLIAGFVWAKSTDAIIYVNDEKFRGKTMVISQVEPNTVAYRNMNGENSNIEISARRNTKLSLSNGEMLVYSVETGELLFSGREYSVKGNVAIQVNLEEGEDATLDISAFLSHRQIHIECDK